MSLFKKKITEQEAASQFVLYIMEEAQHAWPTIYKNLKGSFKEKLVVEDERMPAYDLALAAIAQDLQAVKNLFPKDQAERIRKWVFKCIDIEEWGDYAVGEVKEYAEKVQTAIENIETGGDPMSAIESRLLHRWLGEGIGNFEIEINGRKTGVIDPILVMMTMGFLIEFVGFWKRIKDNFKLVEGDLPLDYEGPLKGLHGKPDGTIQYYDEHGDIKEKWVPPEQLEEVLSKKRFYQVLIKGPWDGIKEAHWELSDDSAKKFVDEKGYAYAVCVYKKGKPKYILSKKKVWERLEDEVQKILLNPNLSDKQRLDAVEKLEEGAS